VSFECVIVGGGIAGLQAAIQLGRYSHHVAVIDSNNGRSTLCRSYHNILGWPNGVSGETLRNLGRAHAEGYNINFFEDTVIAIEKSNMGFLLSTISGNEYVSKRVLLATGVMDRIPDIKNIFPCLGISIYVCPDCDGYEVKNKKVLVLGSGKTGANLARTLSYWTKSITYINHDNIPIEGELHQKLTEKQISYIQNEVNEIVIGDQESKMTGVKLKDGTFIEAERGFIGFGGNEVRSDLLKGLGIERLENKHIVVNPRTKETNIKNIWAAGDIGVHSEQVTIAMGDGMQAAIWIHKSILNDKHN